tara:strand:+ start:603 stop:923 length:321 start_codon:yes stop_codon:yes gene_type:complete
MTVGKLLPEKIKPGLNVLVDWNGRFEKAKVIRKLKKNWLVRIPKRDCSSIGGVNGRYSVPPQSLHLDVSFTKEGRVLLANEKDHQHLFSKEHTDWAKSMTTEAEKL